MPDPYGRYRDPATDMRGVRAFVASPLHSTFRAWFDKFLPLPKTAAWAWIPEPLMAAAWAASATWGEFYREVNARCGCGVFSVFAKDVLQAPPPYGPGLGKFDMGVGDRAPPTSDDGGRVASCEQEEDGVEQGHGRDLFRRDGRDARVGARAGAAAAVVRRGRAEAESQVGVYSHIQPPPDPFGPPAPVRCITPCAVNFTV